MTEIIGPAQIGLVHTPNAKPGTAYGPALAAILSEAGFEAARREIAALLELDLPYLNSTSMKAKSSDPALITLCSTPAGRA